MEEGGGGGGGAAAAATVAVDVGTEGRLVREGGDNGAVKLLPGATPEQDTSAPLGGRGTAGVGMRPLVLEEQGLLCSSSSFSSSFFVFFIISFFSLYVCVRIYLCVGVRTCVNVYTYVCVGVLCSSPSF